MGILAHSTRSTMMLRVLLALAVMAVAVHSQYSSGWRWPRQMGSWNQNDGMGYSSGMGFSGMQRNGGQMCTDRWPVSTCQKQVENGFCSNSMTRMVCRYSCGACDMNFGMNNGMNNGMNTRSFTNNQDQMCTVVCCRRGQILLAGNCHSYNIM